MPNNYNDNEIQINNIQIKVGKTIALLAIYNILLHAFYSSDSGLGQITSLVANAGLLYSIHELGKRRRPGSNAINRIVTFFSANTDTAGRDLDNALRNVVNGGAAIVDEITDQISIAMENANRPKPQQ